MNIPKGYPRFAYWEFAGKGHETARDKIIEAIENTLQLYVRGIIYSGTDDKRERQTGGNAAPTNVSEKESR